MKYLIGFIVGVIFTTIFFVVLQNRGDQPLTEPTSPPVAAAPPSEGLKDFEQFYQQFHSDSTYQLAHILFPLEGIPPSADSLTLVQGGFRWQANEWTLHREFDDMDGEFVRDLRVLSEDMILEQIQHNSGQYGMERRFARFDDGWYLIYYAAMNKLAEQ
ncbi:MAG: hypothetical protein AAGG75_21670 [Bacteroidota bacterium]